MSLISLILVIALVGLVLWLITSFVPMDPKVKLLLQVVVVIALLLWILRAFGFDIRI